MSDYLNVTVIYDGMIFLESKYIYLEPNSDFYRKFVFKDIVFKKFVPLMHESCTVTIEVSSVASFKIEVSNCSDFLEEEFWLSGTVNHDEYNIYLQALVDVFYAWETNQSIDWFALPPGDPIKHQYIMACMKESGISTDFIERDVYYIDASLIRETDDFLYLVSREFYGDKGYFGWDMYTFGDCLISVCNEKGYMTDKKVVFLHADKISDPSILAIIEEAKEILLKYEFTVV